MTVLVTGANGGIGRAIVEEFESVGVRVLTQDLYARPDRSLDIVGDLLDSAVLGEIRDLVEREGTTSVVAAHGIASSAAVNATSKDLLRRAIRVNTLSFMNLYEAIDPTLHDRDGTYVAISSQAGLVGEANNGPYCASKFAIVGWARARAVADATAIRVLCPGATETPLLMDALQGMADADGISLEELLRQRNAQTAAGRLGSTKEIGRSARWLAQLTAPKLLVAAVTGGEVLR